VLYKLDLSDARLALPVAVYDLSPGEGHERFGTTPPAKAKDPRPAFFAPDRPLPGTVPVLAGKEGLRTGKPGDGGAVFFALPADTKAPPAASTPLYEYRHRDGTRRAYLVDPHLSLPGFERAGQPLCLVWRPGG
jgi:hypothetical protein